MKINLRLLRIYLAKIYPRYNLASIIKFLVHRAAQGVTEVLYMECYSLQNNYAVPDNSRLKYLNDFPLPFQMDVEKVYRKCEIRQTILLNLCSLLCLFEDIKWTIIKYVCFISKFRNLQTDKT